MYLIARMEILKELLEAVKLLKKDFPKIDVVAGNVATGTGAKNLVTAGADVN